MPSLANILNLKRNKPVTNKSTNDLDKVTDIKKSSDNKTIPTSPIKKFTNSVSTTSNAYFQKYIVSAKNIPGNAIDSFKLQAGISVWSFAASLPGSSLLPSFVIALPNFAIIDRDKYLKQQNFWMTERIGSFLIYQGEKLIDDKLKTARNKINEAASKIEEEIRKKLSNFNLNKKKIKDAVNFLNDLSNPSTEVSGMPDIIANFSNAFRDPMKGNWFILEIPYCPIGWYDPSRAVFQNVIKPYIKNLNLSLDFLDYDLTTETVLYFFPDILTTRIRKVSLVYPSIDSTSVTDATYHIPFTFPGASLKFDELNLTFLKEKPALTSRGIDLLSYVLQVSHSSINTVVIDTNRLEKTVENYLKEEFSAFISKAYYVLTALDFFELCRASIIDDNGVHYYPYDYLIPEVRIHEVVPTYDGNYLQVHTNIYYNCFYKSITRHDLEYNNSSNKALEFQVNLAYQNREKRFSNFKTYAPEYGDSEGRKKVKFAYDTTRGSAQRDLFSSRGR